MAVPTTVPMKRWTIGGEIDKGSPLVSMNNPVVFMDVAIGNHPAGRIQMELFANVTPRTTENFRQLCTGEFRRQGNPVGYKGASFHRIIKDFMVQGGDIISGDGTGCTSIYGDKFDDENFSKNHTAPGLLSMANSGPNTNGCQFFITCAPCEWLDDKHVVFGRVIEGMPIVRMIEAVPAPQGSPKLPVTIIECGQMY